jgi:hypothetical protein
LVLLMSSYLVAEYIRDGEPVSDKPDSTRDRMTAALAACRDNLDLAIFGEQGTFEQPTLEALCENLSVDEKYALLVEIRLADPFFPYQFEMTKKRDKLRIEEMRHLAHRELHLDRDAAVAVDDAMRVVAKAYSKGIKGWIESLDAKDWLIIVGSGALLAGAAVVAAPLIAAALPAAAGLSGAAAVSAGLASLGGGSIAAGGLGMAGGMWALGVTGATLGGVAGVTAAALAGGDGAGLVQAEVLKLCISFELAAKGCISRSTSEFEAALDQIHDAVREVIATESKRNEKDSERLKGLQKLDETLTFAGEFMTERLKEHSS